jgi:ribonucleoside-diphosphate reductase alpha subunit
MTTMPKPSPMQVQKRNGEFQDVSFDKITKRIKLECENLNIDPILIAQRICSQIKNKITTSEIDEFTARVSAARITSHPDYGVLASRILISNYHKIHKRMNLYKFTDKVEKMYNYKDAKNNKIQLLSDSYYKTVTDNSDFFNNLIDYKKDYRFDYFGYKTLEKSYLHKCDGVCVESPQDMILRVSIGIHGNDLERVKESYGLMSDKYFTHASPSLFNAGSPDPQFLSCFLLGVDDDLNSIYKSYGDCARISKRAGGIGVHVSSLRAKNSIIKGTNGESSGLVPVCRQYNMTAVHVNQGGRRKGSIAVYLEPHHPDIMDFLELKRPHGDEESRARDIFPAMWISDLFMKRVEKNEMWSTFSPDETPTNLADVFGDEYEALYLEYESDGLYREQIPARTIWKAIVDCQVESGTPYIGYKDAVNRKNNQQHYGVIKSSNLCIEINEVSTADEYACCTLSSVCLPEFVNVVKNEHAGDAVGDSVNKDAVNTYIFDFEKLSKVVGVVTRNLNRIVDLNKYPTPETEKSNQLHRPLGIGVQGLADVFMKCHIPYDSQVAAELNKLIFETMYHAAVSASCKLAQETEAYSTFKGSPMSKGIFQFDMWDVCPSDRYDWDALRKDVMAHGVRNSLLMALMPTASTSQIMGNVESFEAYQSNIFKRKTLAGNFVVVNKYLINELIELDLWSDEMKNKIIANDGSVKNISEIPDEIKDVYKTIWEMSNKTYIDMAADRGAFVCQSQSMNLWMKEPNFKSISSMHMYAWKKGLKTGQYYLRSQPPSDPQQFTIDPALMKLEEEKKAKFVCTDDVCVSCSG